MSKLKSSEDRSSIISSLDESLSDDEIYNNNTGQFMLTTANTNSSKHIILNKPKTTFNSLIFGRKSMQRSSRLVENTNSGYLNTKGSS